MVQARKRLVDDEDKDDHGAYFPDDFNNYHLSTNLNFKRDRGRRGWREDDDEDLESGSLPTHSSSRTSNKENRSTELPICYWDLEPYFGRKLNEVAEIFGVSRSTLKRVCRELGIPRWPRKRRKVNFYVSLSDVKQVTESVNGAEEAFTVPGVPVSAQLEQPPLEMLTHNAKSSNLRNCTTPNARTQRIRACTGHEASLASENVPTLNFCKPSSSSPQRYQNPGLQTTNGDPVGPASCAAEACELGLEFQLQPPGMSMVLASVPDALISKLLEASIGKVFAENTGTSNRSKNLSPAQRPDAEQEFQLEIGRLLENSIWDGHVSTLHETSLEEMVIRNEVDSQEEENGCPAAQGQLQLAEKEGQSKQSCSAGSPTKVHDSVNGEEGAHAKPEVLASAQPEQPPIEMPVIENEDSSDLRNPCMMGQTTAEACEKGLELKLQPAAMSIAPSSVPDAAISVPPEASIQAVFTVSTSTSHGFIKLCPAVMTQQQDSEQEFRLAIGSLPGNSVSDGHFSTLPETGELLISNELQPGAMIIASASVPDAVVSTLPEASIGQLRVPQKEVKRKQSRSVRTRTKVRMQGNDVGRAVDLTSFRGYDELIDGLEEMFEIKGELRPRNTWKIVFIDDEEEMMLMGDDPWQDFCNMVRKIFIVSIDKK